MKSRLLSWWAPGLVSGMPGPAMCPGGHEGGRSLAQGRPPGMIEDRNLVRGYACDATVGAEVTEMFARVTAELGTPRSGSIQCRNLGSRRHSRYFRPIVRTGVAYRLLWRISCRPGSHQDDAAARTRHDHL